MKNAYPIYLSIEANLLLCRITSDKMKLEIYVFIKESTAAVFFLLPPVKKLLQVFNL